MVELWVFSEEEALLQELIIGAGVLAEKQGGKVGALVLGPRPAVEAGIASSVDTVYWLGEVQERQLVEDFVPTIADLVSRHQPALLLVGATKRGKAVAGRLSARLGVSAVADARQMRLEGGSLAVDHMVYGGGAVRTEQPQRATALVTIGHGVFDPQAAGSGRKAEIVAVPFVEPEWRLSLKERTPKTAARVDLAGAKRVVCPGRGVGKREDLEMIAELASLTGAEIGCTRPLTEGLNWLPREHYIGVSGVILKPELYIGIGVSGQVQHTIGVNEARVIVGINKDPSAPIFDQADYGIVGDLYMVVPALIEALKSRKVSHSGENRE